MTLDTHLCNDWQAPSGWGAGGHWKQIASAVRCVGLTLPWWFVLSVDPRVRTGQQFDGPVGGVLERLQHEVGAGREQAIGILVDARGDGDPPGEARRPHGLEDRPPRVLLADAGQMDRDRRDHPIRGAERQAGHEFGVRGIAVLDLKAERAPLANRVGIEVDAENTQAAALQARADGRAEAAETQQDYIVRRRPMLLGLVGFARRALALEDPEQRLADGVEPVRIGDMVDRRP